jgi:hypothetical protein
LPLDAHAGEYSRYSSTLDTYDASRLTDRWSIAQLSVARTRLVATSLGNVALFAGGGDGREHNLNAVDLYDRQTGSWTTALLSVNRSGLAATSVGNVAIFAGGESSNSCFL